MLDFTLLQSVAVQMMEGEKVLLEENAYKVERTSYQRFRTVTFQMNGHEYQAIEQNADKPSQWGKLAREGHKVVQFRDGVSGKYVAVAVDGKVQAYGQ